MCVLSRSPKNNYDAFPKFYLYLLQPKQCAGERRGVAALQAGGGAQRQEVQSQQAEERVVPRHVGPGVGLTVLCVI